MKITLEINDALLLKIKEVSVRERKSLAPLIEEGLRLLLLRTNSHRPATSRPLAIHKGYGVLMAGVDPLSNRSLLDTSSDHT